MEQGGLLAKRVQLGGLWDPGAQQGEALSREGTPQAGRAFPLLPPAPTATSRLWQPLQ